MKKLSFSTAPPKPVVAKTKMWALRMSEPHLQMLSASARAAGSSMAGLVKWLVEQLYQQRVAGRPMPLNVEEPARRRDRPPSRMWVFRMPFECFQMLADSARVMRMSKSAVVEYLIESYFEQNVKEKTKGKAKHTK